jgi:hypothetical protein
VWTRSLTYLSLYFLVCRRNTNMGGPFKDEKKYYIRPINTAGSSSLSLLSHYLFPVQWVLMKSISGACPNSWLILFTLSWGNKSFTLFLSKS